MSSSVFIPCNKKVLKNIENTIEQFELKEAYIAPKKERILKNDDLLLLQKRKYVFLKAFSSDGINKIQQVQALLLK